MQTTRREQITVIVCMYIGYLMLMFCRTAFTTVSPALVEDPDLSLTTTHIGDILGYAALGSLVGKLLTGFVADHFGGRLTLLVALGVVASLTAAMGYSASFSAFVLFIFCLQLLRAGGWPALAANAGDQSAQQAQAELAKKMTPSQVAQAQKLAKAWADSRQPQK